MADPYEQAILRNTTLVGYWPGGEMESETIADVKGSAHLDNITGTPRKARRSLRTLPGRMRSATGCLEYAGETSNYARSTSTTVGVGSLSWSMGATVLLRSITTGYGNIGICQSFSNQATWNFPSGTQQAFTYKAFVGTTGATYTMPTNKICHLQVSYTDASSGTINVWLNGESMGVNGGFQKDNVWNWEMGGPAVDNGNTNCMDGFIENAWLMTRYMNANEMQNIHKLWLKKQARRSL